MKWIIGNCVEGHAPGTLTRARGLAGWKPAQLTFETPGGKDHGAQRSGPRPGNEVFALLDKTGTGQCLVAVTGTSLSTAGVFGFAQLNGTTALAVLVVTSPSFQQAPPSKERSPSALPVCLKSVRSRRTRSAKTS